MKRRADLVLEGGGVKGIGLVGAIRCLSEAGYTFPRIAGTSAGAIVGALAAAGIGAERLGDLMREVDYTAFRDRTLLARGGRPGMLASLLLRQGVYRGDALHRWLTEQLGAAGIRTFGDLRQADEGSSLPEHRRYRLVVVVSDVSQARMTLLPWDYPRYGLDPDAQPVADAVRASMSIPFVFRPRALPTSRGAVTLVDGGLLSNYPVDVFDRTDGRPPRWPTIRVKLSGREREALPHTPIAGLPDLVGAVLTTLVTAHDRRHLDDPAVVSRTIFADTSGVSSLDFGLGPAARDGLYRKGYEAAAEFLEEWQAQPEGA